MSARTYAFITPPGWLRLNLRGEPGPQAKRFAEVVMAGYPMDSSAAARASVVRSITELATSAKADGVLDLVLPVKVVDGSTANASFAVTAFDTDALDPLDVISGIAAQDSTAELIEVADLVALRTVAEEAVDASAARAEIVAMARAAGGVDSPAGEPEPSLPELTSRRVRYFIGHPDRPGDWIIAMVSVVQADNPSSRQFSDTMIELFDQVILTFRFQE